MKALSETILGRVLGLLADAVTRYRWLFFWPQILLCGLCVFYTVRHLTFDANRDNLVGPGQTYHANYLKYKEEFTNQDDILVVVESDDAEKNRQFIERLGRRVEQETNQLFTSVLYRNDFKMLGNKALLFASEDDLKGLESKLNDYMPFIQKFTEASNLVSLFDMINSQIYHSKRETNAENNALMSAIPVLKGIVDQAAASLERPGTPPSPGLAALFGAGDKDIYITEGTNNLIYLLIAQAQRDELNDKAVERMRALIEQTKLEVPGVNVGMTGGPVLDHDEMEQSQKDTTVASILSLVICALIFIYGYQETGRPLKATFCLLVGLGYTMAFATLTVGHLNILTITFMPMLIGLAIDFGVHLITRYEEELRLGRSEAIALHTAMTFTGQGIFTGALTTAVAFLAMGLTDFAGIKEMGIICGGGMLICFITMMTLLPVLLFRGRQNTLDIKQAAEPQLRARIESIWLRRPKSTIVVTAILCTLALTQFHRVYFDYDLLHLQANGLPAVEFVKKQIASSSKSVLFGVVVADNAEQAIRLENQLTNLSTVKEVESMAPRVIGDQKEKLAQIKKLKAEIAPLHFAPTDIRPVVVTNLSATLYSTEGYMNMAADETEKDDPEVAKQLRALRWAINPLIREMLADPDASSRKLALFQQALFDDIHGTFRNLQQQEDSSPLRAGDLPQALQAHFIGKHQKFLLQVYPREDVWQRTNQEKFVKQLQTVVPNVTGEPVELYYYIELLKDSYVQAAYYSLGAIVIMVFLHFRTLSSVVLALLPVAIGSIWLGGIMGWARIPFNPANIMTLPLVLGIGVTNGIHILNRFAEEKKPGILGKSTGKAVFVSGLTAISGFGSLIIGRHQGIRSLGEIMSIGMATCMIAALAFLPALLKVLHPESDAPKKQPSGDNARSTLGREEPR
jgi:hopanoid biosynthesis associated RND transporter like protein HpnN